MKKIVFTLLLILICFFKSNAQPPKEEIKAPKESQLKKGDQDAQKFAYVDAIKSYERIANKGYKSVELFQKLGNSYYFNSELQSANKWYDELFALNQPLEAEYYYRYSQTLKSIGNYKKADEMMAIFNQKSGDDERSKLFLKNKDYLSIIKANSGRYKIEDAGINSKFMDYGAAIWNDKLIFASSRETKGVKETWNGQNFTNLYASEIGSDGTLGAPEKLSKQLNSKFNEDSPVFTNDGKTMYFTRNNYNKGKRGKDAEKTTLLKIYKAVLVENEWEDVQELPSINSDDYSSAHPALSPDEKYLYFASDMLGTFGQSDLYKVKINSDGTYGKPENLGKTINTPGKETFPFISDDNELYFATDGRPGLGGLDIFVSKINKDGSLSEPVNIGGPINDKTDDFAFMIDTKSKVGFFTSNRDGGNGFDDIYKFKEVRPLDCNQKLTGVISEKETGDLIANAEVILLDNKMNEIEKTTSSDKGVYEFKVKCGQIYYVRTKKDGFFTKEERVETSKKPNDEIFNIIMIRDKVIIKDPPPVLSPGEDGQPIPNIEPIYFDLNKWDIRPDAEVELAKVWDYMEQFPNHKIDVRSHTDSRDTAANNLKLSDNRVKSTIAWLISKGIDPKRLTGRGYGESKLKNKKCKDGVECTEEEHQENRRSEFIIKK